MSVFEGSSFFEACLWVPIEKVAMVVWRQGAMVLYLLFYKTLSGYRVLLQAAA